VSVTTCETSAAVVVVVPTAVRASGDDDFFAHAQQIPSEHKSAMLCHFERIMDASAIHCDAWTVPA
jgi:hypothetical protein